MERIEVLSEMSATDYNTIALKAKALSHINERINAKKRLATKFLRKWALGAVAAIALLLATVGLYFLLPVKPTPITFASADTPAFTTLPDGSKVWLNKHSSIIYPENFTDNRHITLYGEAYFEVTHDKSHPFSIDGTYLDVTVLGTKFTFHSADADSPSYVSLIEGRVKVCEANGNGCLVLKVGQKATYNPADGYITVANVNTPLDAAWHDNNIPFSNATIIQIAAALEQLYAVTVHVDSSVDTTSTYSGGALRSDSIDATLAKLANTIPIKYIYKNGEVWIIARK
jgi:ferric-dicitrate binding protein FerR (iron transport regulator)